MFTKVVAISKEEKLISLIASISTEEYSVLFNKVSSHEQIKDILRFTFDNKKLHKALLQIVGWVSDESARPSCITKEQAKAFVAFCFERTFNSY